MAMQNNIESLKDKVQLGEMTADQANVQLVRDLRVRLVTARLPAAVRKALNAAVKTGELGHIKKDGHKPEAYFHPTFEYMVAGERNRVADSVALALRKYAGFPA